METDGTLNLHSFLQWQQKLINFLILRTVSCESIYVYDIWENVDPLAKTFLSFNISLVEFKKMYKEILNQCLSYLFLVSITLRNSLVSSLDLLAKGFHKKCSGVHYFLAIHAL